MTSATPVLPVRPSFFRSIADSNPFYLISACFMLAGCLALTNSLSWWSIPTPRLLVLFATLNIYEAALIGLAAYLILVRGLRRDGMWLIVLEAFFLIDVTFLNAELSTQHSWLGPALAAFSFVAAIAKVWAILFILGVRRSPAKFAFILIQIAAILAMPLVFGRANNGSVSPLEFYLAWWFVGMMPAVYEFLRKCLEPENSAAASRMVFVYLVLPWLSLAAHLGILHYVYDVPFYGAMAAPALLALAMVLSYGVPEGVMPRKDIGTLRVLLPLAAVVVSISSPAQLTLILGRSHVFFITTLQVALVMAYLEFMYSFLRSYWIFTTLAGIVAVLVDVYGPTMDQMSNFSSHYWSRVAEIVSALTPTTPTAWGTIFVALAFIFLVLGAVVSLRRSIPPVDPD
jgi:hypothetical protein